MYRKIKNKAAWAVTAALAAYMIWPVLATAVEEFIGPVEYEEPPPEETPSTEVVPGEEPPEEGPAEPPAFVPYRNRDAWLDAGTLELSPEDNEELPLHFENWVLWEGLDPGPWLGGVCVGPGPGRPDVRGGSRSRE